MSAFRRPALVVASLGLLAGGASAGKLDLDIYGAGRVSFAADPAAPGANASEIWRPGDPRDLREAPRSVEILGETGYTAMGAVGAAQSLHGAGSGRAAKAEGAGFIAVAAISFWRLLQTLWN